MTLRDWVAQHRNEVVPEDASRSAVALAVALVDRHIGDAEGVPSDDGRLEHAFAACLASARAALAACGYRLRSSAHHYLAIESLQYTIRLTDDEVSQFQNLRRMRARAMYEQVGVVSSKDAEAALAAARHLRIQLAAWLAREHADLAPQP
jgi:hypothetical protein